MPKVGVITWKGVKRKSLGEQLSSLVLEFR